MSTPSSTPGGVSATAKAGVTASAEVQKKSSLKYSPARIEVSDPLHQQGMAYRAVEVDSGATVKAFTNEDECQAYCEKLNNS